MLQDTIIHYLNLLVSILFLKESSSYDKIFCQIYMSKAFRLMHVVMHLTEEYVGFMRNAIKG